MASGNDKLLQMLAGLDHSVIIRVDVSCHDQGLGVVGVGELIEIPFEFGSIFNSLNL
jgi:hypothetical protein